MIPVHWYTTFMCLITPGHGSGVPIKSTIGPSWMTEHVFLDWHLSAIKFQAVAVPQCGLVEEFPHIVKSYRPKSAFKISIVSLPVEHFKVPVYPLQMVTIAQKINNHGILVSRHWFPTLQENWIQLLIGFNIKCRQITTIYQLNS